MAEENEREAVRLAVRELWEAYRLQDPERLREAIDEEYQGPGGLDREGYVAGLTAPGFVVSDAAVNVESAQVRVDGERAVVSYSATLGAADSEGRWRVENDSTDVFLKREGRWRLYRGTGREETHPE